MCEQCHEKEYEQTRDTYAGMEITLTAMKKALAVGDTNKVFECHKAILSTVEIINFFMEQNDDKFDESDYLRVGENLDYFVETANELLSLYKSRVA